MLPVDNVPYAVKDNANISAAYRGTLVTNCGYNAESAGRVIADGYAEPCPSEAPI